MQLRPALLECYAALDAVLPGRVRFSLPAALPVGIAVGQRHDLAALEAMIARLPPPE